MGWVMQGWGGMGYVGVGGTYRGGVGYVGVGRTYRGRVGLCRGRGEWVMQGWGGSCRGELCRGGVYHTVVEWAVKNFTG